MWTGGAAHDFVVLANAKSSFQSTSNARRLGTEMIGAMARAWFVPSREAFSQPWKLPTQQAVSNKNQPYQFSWNPYWSQKSKNLRMTKVVLKHKTLLKTWNRQLQNCSSKTSHKALCPFSRPVKSVPRLSALSRLLQPIQTLELSGKQMKTESR